jgi:nitronate monooxygenase
MTDELCRRLRLPIVAAPMFLVSGPDLVIAACRAGIVGSFPAANARTAPELEAWLIRISTDLAKSAGANAPYAVNVIVQSAGSERFRADLELIEKYQAPIVITSVGPPGEVVNLIHAYGGRVFHDVATMRHAEKAIEAGVDGLILLTAGAGGHTGTANPFAFVPQVRRIWDGTLLLAGCLSDGRSALAAQTLGADLAYMGTRFAATQESLASPEYKSLLVSQRMADILTTDRISGLPANFLRGSLERVGLDPHSLPPATGSLRSSVSGDLKAWRDIWSGGHGVGLIDDIPTVAELVDRLAAEYEVARREAAHI